MSDFWLDKAKNAGILSVFRVFLTQYKRKSDFLNLTVFLYAMLYRYNHRKSRDTHKSVFLEDLDFDIAGGNFTESEFFTASLEADVNTFLKILPEDKRVLFIRRCFMFESDKEIAKRFGMSESSVRVKTMRIRNELKKYLSERGYEVE